MDEMISKHTFFYHEILLLTVQWSYESLPKIQTNVMKELLTMIRYCILVFAVFTVMVFAFLVYSYALQSSVCTISGGCENPRTTLAN